MATYDQLRMREDSEPVWWLEISGLPYMVPSDRITAANLATLFGDGYTETQTVLRLLHKPTFSDSKRFEPLGGIVPDGGFQVTLANGPITGYPHGFCTWLFGRNRATIQRSRLTADVALHAGGVGHDWAWSADIGTNGVAQDFYCGLETVRGTPDFAGNLLVTVTRSRWLSEAYAHRGTLYGSQTLYPWVTDHPTVWRGRIVTLFQTFMDGAGNLASTDGTSATVRAEAHRVRGILSGYGFTPTGWMLRCAGIESLLDRKICRKLPRAKVGKRILIADHIISAQQGAVAAADNPGTVMVVYLTNNATGVSYTYPIFLTPGTYYTPATFVQALNDVLAAGPTDIDGNAWLGQLSLELSDEFLTFRYLTDGATALSCFVSLEERYSPDLWGSTLAWYWDRICGQVDDAGFYVGDPNPAIATEYTAVLPRYEGVILGRRGEGDENGDVRLELEHGPGDSPIADFSGDFGGVQNGYVALVSSAGKEIMFVTEVDAGAGVVVVSRRLNYVGPRLDHVQDAQNPVYLQRVYVTPQSAAMVPARAVLRPLLSTGVAAYNDADYDTLAEGVGAAWPNETRAAGAATTEGLVDVASFERFFAEAWPYFDGYAREYILEPTTVREWLTSRLAFLGGALVVENGQLGARRTVAPVWHEGRTVSPHHVIRPLEATGETRLERIVNALQYRWQWMHSSEKFHENALLSPYDDSDPNTGRVVELTDKGVSTDLGKLQLLAQEILAEYAIEPTEYAVVLSKAHRDLEPGMAVHFSDWGSNAATDDTQVGRGLPSLEGTRGHASVPMLVLEVSVDQGTGHVTAKLLRLGLKRGGFSPSAWLETIAKDTPVAGTARLIYTDRVFSDLDAEGFQIGEKVRIVRISAPTAAVQESAGHTITAINLTTRAIEIQPNYAGAGIVSGETLMLIHDPYQTAGQTASAKQWCAIGDASGDIGDAADACYDW